jgi:outer membrane protein assembly factor BamB
MICPSAFADAPNVVPGWTHNSSGSEVPGINLDSGGISYSSPVIAEIDGDVSDGKEVAVGSSSGTLYVFRSNGSLLWSSTIPQLGGPCSRGAISSSPAVGAIFGDGQPYVVVGYGDSRNGAMVVFGLSRQRRYEYWQLAPYLSKAALLIFNGILSPAPQM